MDGTSAKPDTGDGLGAVREVLPFPREPQNGTSSTVRTLSILVGGRILDGDYDPVKKEPVLGLEYDQYRPGSIGWEVGFAYSNDDGSVSGVGDVEATFWEVYAGVRKTWGDEKRLHPYVGGGFSYIDVDGEVKTGAVTVTDDDASFGLYVHGGASFDLTQHLRLGVDLRFIGLTDIDISDVNSVGDADYAQLSITFGYCF
jgi:opacity protein-like surface antigen